MPRINVPASTIYRWWNKRRQERRWDKINKRRLNRRLQLKEIKRRTAHKSVQLAEKEK